MILSMIFDMAGSLPLKAGYRLSDFLAWVAGDVVRYRRKVVTENLTKSFPEKSRQEIARIRKDFYRFLTDYFVETMRLGRMSKSEISRRMTFGNIRLLEDLHRQGRPIALMLGHYGNWEWVSSLPLHLPEEWEGSQIYHPLENKEADKAFSRIRSRFGAVNVPLRDTFRYLMEMQKSGAAPITGFIADQAPGYDSTHLWLDFLNHETGVYSGPEKMMRRLGGVMVYCRMSRPSRGHYHCDFELISDDVAAEPVFAPTREYFRRLESDIKVIPHLWLWSHRRWKRPRIR